MLCRERVPSRPRAQGPWLGPPRCGQRPLGRQLWRHWCAWAGSGGQRGPAGGAPPPPPARPALGPLAGALRPPPQPHSRRQLAMSVTEAVGPMWILFPDAWRAGRRVAAGQPACAGCPRPPVSAGPSGWFRGRESGVGCTSCSGPGLSSGWVASRPFTSDFPLEDGAHVTPSTVPDGAGGFGAGVKQGTPRGLEARS